MPQRPKQKVRRAIIDAAVQVLSEVGLERAKLGDIAQRAGTSVGNVYKYFGSKEEIFMAAIPPEFTTQLTDKIRAQVEALGERRDVAALEADHPYRRASEALLRFSVLHRSQIIFLLRHAQGTAHGSFPERVVHLLVTLAEKYAEAAYPNLVMSRAERRSLTRTYRAFLLNLATILAEEKTERGLREAVRLLTVYHLSGLRALFQASPHHSTQPRRHR